MRFGRTAALWLLAILVCASIDARVSSWVQARSGGGSPAAPAVVSAAHLPGGAAAAAAPPAPPAVVSAAHLPGGAVAAAAPHHPRLHGWSRVRQHWLGRFDT